MMAHFAPYPRKRIKTRNLLRTNSSFKVAPFADISEARVLLLLAVNQCSGLGYYIINYTNFANYVNVIAGIIMVALMVTVLNILINALRRYTVR